MGKNCFSRKSAAVVCALAVAFSALASGASSPVSGELLRPLNSYQQDGYIQTEDLLTVAEDYTGVSEDFLDAISMREDVSVSRLKKYALEYNLPAKYLQRFIDDSFVFKMGDSYEYIPVDYSLSTHSYDWDNLYTDQWGKDYIVDGESHALRIIDVSSHQGKIDWDAVAADGVDGVFVRLGYRGYTKGALNIDDYFYRNLEGAQAAGLDVGVYFYSQSINSKEAREEAEFVLDALEGYELQLPVVYDIEGAQTSAYRTYGVSVQTNTNMVMAFCDTIWEAGYDTMFYSYTSFLAKNLDLSQLQGYDLWMAQYYPVPFCPYNFQIWQYDYQARVDGIDAPVDMNLLFTDYEPNWWSV